MSEVNYTLRAQSYFSINLEDVKRSRRAFRPRRAPARVEALNRVDADSSGVDDRRNTLETFDSNADDEEC